MSEEPKYSDEPKQAQLFDALIVAAAKDKDPCPTRNGSAHDCDPSDGWCRDRLGRSWECPIWPKLCPDQ